MPRQVDYYFSLSSPWAYIGHKAFRDVVATYGLAVNHKPVILVDLFSETGGLPLVRRHPVRQRYRMVELQRWCDKRGLNFHLRPKYSPFNARLVDGRRDRRDRSRPRSGSVSAVGISGGLGRRTRSCG